MTAPLRLGRRRPFVIDAAAEARLEAAAYVDSFVPDGDRRRTAALESAREGAANILNSMPPLSVSSTSVAYAVPPPATLGDLDQRRSDYAERAMQELRDRAASMEEIIAKRYKRPGDAVPIATSSVAATSVADASPRLVDIEDPGQRAKAYEARWLTQFKERAASFDESLAARRRQDAPRLESAVAPPPVERAAPAPEAARVESAAVAEPAAPARPEAAAVAPEPAAEVVVEEAMWSAPEPVVDVARAATPDVAALAVDARAAETEWPRTSFAPETLAKLSAVSFALACFCALDLNTQLEAAAACAFTKLAADLKAASIRSASLEDALRDAEAREADARVDVAYARAKLDEDC